MYQTPQVSFANMVTPLLVNSRTWQIDAIDPSDASAPLPGLRDYIQKLFETLLPPNASQPYDIQVACRYAFALAAGYDADLVTALPVLLGPRFTIAPGADMLVATASFRDNMDSVIRAWFARNDPVRAKGMFVFSVAIYSGLGVDMNDGAKRPLLRIDDLRLRLDRVADL